MNFHQNPPLTVNTFTPLFLPLAEAAREDFCGSFQSCSCNCLDVLTQPKTLSFHNLFDFGEELEIWVPGP